MNIQELVQDILKRKPTYLFVGENHGDALIKDFVSDLITNLKPHYKSIGLYLEALVVTSDVQFGNYGGRIYSMRKSVYEPFIQREKNRTVIYGIDDPRHSSGGHDGKLPPDWIPGDSKERIDTWEKEIAKGDVQLKIVLCGSNHIDTRNDAADIVNRYSATSRFILVNWGKRVGNTSIEVINGDNRLYEIILE